MNGKFDGLVRWSLSNSPSNSRWSHVTSSKASPYSRSSCENIDFDGAGPRLQHVCINENYGSAQDGRHSSAEGIAKKSLLSRRTWCIYHRGALWIGALNHHRYRCVVGKRKKWGGDEPHFQFTVVCSRAWPEKAKMLALTNRSICGQDPGWSWWLRLRLFRGLKVAPTSNSSTERIRGASCWANGTRVQNMIHHKHPHRFCPI
jgi:hypothetical protein